MNPLDAFSSKFSNEHLDYIELKRNFFLESAELKNLRENIPFEPLSSGLFLGKDEKSFKPSTALLEILSKSSTNKVFINDKAEWLFLCGRDAFKESIIKNRSFSEPFLIQNERDENLGLGSFFKKGKMEFVKNAFDRGDFLRREK
ncbi:hypothetical protein COV13_04060 [Candidatus Woesearchaeota archaeon CG10_big_fil_rev_8_21_14_0_10_32_9]|nr:MAG: hypothetical protein COV13_04060 [Candidatus Woesearchaeota archaeon CG10_big_fil_rev_8_21_14_0_10_32_9]